MLERWPFADYVQIKVIRRIVPLYAVATKKSTSIVAVSFEINSHLFSLVLLSSPFYIIQHKQFLFLEYSQ